jgi:predicted dehydrogenase
MTARVGIVGLGYWGPNLARNLNSLESCELAWCCDGSDASRARWQTAYPDARFTADFDDLLSDPDLDAIAITTPVLTHAELTERTLEAGKHCFVEKPLALTAAEGRRLVATARETGRVVQVGHIFRFHPVTAVLEQALADGRIGAVRYATGRFSGFKRPRMDVGVFQTDGIHYADLFRHLLRRDPTAVSALQRDFLGRGLEDLSVTIVHYDHVPVIVEANYFVPGTHRDCVIVGEGGSLVADYGTSTVTLHLGEHRRAGGGWEAVDTGKEALAPGGDEPLRLELEAFLDACAGRRAVPVTAADGLIAVEVCEAATRSARLGRDVTLAELR